MSTKTLLLIVSLCAVVGCHKEAVTTDTVVVEALPVSETTVTARVLIDLGPRKPNVLKAVQAYCAVRREAEWRQLRVSDGFGYAYIDYARERITHGPYVFDDIDRSCSGYIQHDVDVYVNGVNVYNHAYEQDPFEDRLDRFEKESSGFLAKGPWETDMWIVLGKMRAATAKINTACREDEAKRVREKREADEQARKRASKVLIDWRAEK